MPGSVVGGGVGGLVTGCGGPVATGGATGPVVGGSPVVGGWSVGGGSTGGGSDAPLAAWFPVVGTSTGTAPVGWVGEVVGGVVATPEPVGAITVGSCWV